MGEEVSQPTIESSPQGMWRKVDHKLTHWAHQTYPDKKYWEEGYCVLIKGLLAVLAFLYIGNVVAFLIFAPVKWFAMLLLAIFAVIGWRPIRGLGLTMILATFQKGLLPLGFLNLPLFVICFSVTCIIWIAKDAFILEKFRRTRLDIWVTIFFTISILTTVIHMEYPSMQYTESLYPVLQLIALSQAIGLFVMGRELLHTRRQISPILTTVLGTGVLVSVLGLIDQYTTFSLFSNSFIMSYKEILGYELLADNIMGTLDNPNLLGMYLLYVLPLCFYLAFDENEWWKKEIMLVVSIFLVAVLILTNDVSSWIAMCFGVSIIIFLNLKKFTKKHIPIAAKSIFLILGLYLIYSNTGRGMSRVEIVWPAAWHMFIENPLFGVGMGNFTWQFRQLADSYWNYAFHAHNIYLNILAERGIIAFFAFCGIVATFISNKLRYLILTQKSNHLIVSLLLAIIATLLSGFMQTSFSWLGLEFHFWLYLLITIGVIENHIHWDI